MPNILFLDIDGVVLPNRAHLLPNQTKPVAKVFDPCAVSLLNRACHQRRWKIVIHSSWLRYYQGDTLLYCLSQGIKEGHFHNTEPCCSGEIHWRYDRIDDWLCRHKGEVRQFVILDNDRPDDGYPRLNHLILTDEDEGITMDVYRRLLSNDFRIKK